MSTKWLQFCSAIANDHVMASLLVSAPLRNARQEQQMTALRRRCLLQGAAPPELLAHLAIQGFLNEFAWREEPDETAAVEALRDRRDPQSLLTYACYRSLSDLPDAETLAAAPGAPTALKAVLRVQVVDGQTERGLADAVPALTPIRPGISSQVQAMYEENPYPRWSMLADAHPRPLAEIVSEVAGFQVDAPSRPEVLIAGCGTGRHAIQTARRYAGASVLAVDLSRASLGYAVRRTRELRVSNLSYGQADMLELPALGRAYDVVEAVGSLQCMDDPAQGLAALVSILRPGGLMRLGLYSATAREPLQPAMAMGAGFPRTPDGIRAFRAAILAAPHGDPVRVALEFADFYSTSNCRDLLLHVKEHVHTLAQVRDLLAGAGLEFLGLDLPAGVRERFLAAYDDPADLDQWAAFEADHPHTFRAMYQIWARKPAS